MNAQSEINNRLERVRSLRQEQRKLKAEKKELAGEIKAIDESLSKFLDEIEDIKDGSGVQETIA